MTAAPGAAPTAAGDDGVTIFGGGQPDVVDLADLDRAAHLLATVADRLDIAARLLTVATQAAPSALLTPEGKAAARALQAARSGAAAPARVADDVLDLARRVRGAVITYDHAESAARSALRGVVALDGSLLGTFPVLAVQRFVQVGVAAAVAANVARVTTRTAMALLAPFGRADDVLRWEQRQLRHWAPRATTWALADRRSELLVLGLASGFLGRDGLLVPPSQRVRLAARRISGLLPDAGPTAVVARAGAPQLPVPRDVAGVIANTGLSYREGTETGMRGTPDGTISVQRLHRPDGTVSWVVEIPGTQNAGVTGDSPMDNGTNPRLVGDVPDDMTDAVLDAMHLAGIRSDEPVLLAGHSQGGMVAANVASIAAGTYAIAAVVTAGSPDDVGAVRVPSSVEVLHLRHPQDVVPQASGGPILTGPNVREMRVDPALNGAAPVTSPLDAHGTGRYVTSAEAIEVHADDPQLRDFVAAVDTVLGPEGTTATTRQFVATRDPDLVRLDPVTGLPRGDRLSPVGGPTPLPALSPAAR